MNPVEIEQRFRTGRTLIKDALYGILNMLLIVTEDTETARIDLSVVYVG